MHGENLDGDGYLIRDYHRRMPFAGFLPGLAGEVGVPLWAFYVNRGQAVCSFGLGSKEGAILDFQPANQAWARVEREGFRSFLITEGPGGPSLIEPFCGAAPEARRIMRVGAAEVSVREESAGLEWEAVYFTLANCRSGGLLRRLSLRNRGASRLLGVLADGLPRIVPSGISSFHIKGMSHTAQAWMGAEEPEAGLGFYRVTSSLEDSTEVRAYREGHFSLSLDGRGRRLGLIRDPALVFGPDLGFGLPLALMEDGGSAALKACERPGTDLRNVWPCAFSIARIDLESGEEWTVWTLIGHARSAEEARAMAALADGTAWFEAKRAENGRIISAILDEADCRSADPAFDAYCRQTWLDNVLRGGRPRLFASAAGPALLPLYARKHGDLERDYNSFELPPCPLSSGYGAYRDLNQNQRSDIWFELGAEDADLIEFLSLIKADGTNPLVVQGRAFSLSPEVASALEAEYPGLANGGILRSPFEPGPLLGTLMDTGLDEKKAMESLEAILAWARPLIRARHGEGYWVDHWSYNMDLLDALLGVWPEREEEFLFERPRYMHYQDERRIVPSGRRFSLRGGALVQGEGVEADPEMAVRLAGRAEGDSFMRAVPGGAEPYTMCLMEKLISLALAKAASLDPEGAGLEMEAGKPGWYDALNGLPGICGSSLADGAALRRLLAYIVSAMGRFPRPSFELPEELADLFRALRKGLGQPPMERWRSSLAARDTYRARAFAGFSGRKAVLDWGELRDGLDSMGKALEAALRAAMGADGLLPAYRIHKPLAWEGAGMEPGYFMPTVFESRSLPHFLEGQVRAMGFLADAELEPFAEAVRRSPLYDEGLGMYKVNASLAGEGQELGRCRAFPSGWLENESIWLHMEYKYLLALLRRGLYARFWEAAEKAFPPFMDPEAYGRSILENSSFIVSSAYHDRAMAGRGCVARLSGSTAEFMEIFLYISTGGKPFRAPGGELQAVFHPILPEGLFRADGSVEFSFMGRTRLVHHGGALRGNQAPEASGYRIRLRDGRETAVEGSAIPQPMAGLIRAGEAERVEVFF